MNHIYRLVWCRSRKVLVVASELASSDRGSTSSTAHTVDRRGPGSTSKVLLATLICASGILFASAASAQSIDDSKLDDLQSLIAKYDTSHVTAPATSTASAGQSAASGAANANVSAEARVSPAFTSSLAAVRHVPVTQIRTAQMSGHGIQTSIAATPAIQASRPAIGDTQSALANAIVPAPSLRPQLQQAQQELTAATLSINSSTVEGAGSQPADAVDRNLSPAAVAQLAQQSNSMETPDSKAPGNSDLGHANLAVLTPAIKQPAQPVVSATVAPENVSLVDATPAVSPVAAEAVAPYAPSKAPAASMAMPSPMDKVALAASRPITSSVPATVMLALASKNPVVPTAATDAVDEMHVSANSRVVSARLAAAAVPTQPAKKPVAATAMVNVADTNNVKIALATTGDVADRRLKHPTDANETDQTKSSDGIGDADTSETASVSQSINGISPLAFTPLSSFATTPSMSLMPSLDTSSAMFGPITAAVPVFPTPSSSPTGLIVGNGGVVGTATQLLGPSTNSLFSNSTGYVTDGSLRVNNANFSQGYSVVSVLGIPVLTLNPVGTLLTSTTGALVGGTGVNSHLTLIGGVDSDSYIYDINNGGPSGLLGIALPNQAPAFASTCLNALVVKVACYGINAAQDYQVLVGDGATANGSKEVVIGTNASHTLPLVDADTGFPGNGINDPNDPTGVPTADYEARLGHSVVIGDSASGTANAQTILGAEATSDVANSVALGYQSSATRGAVSGYIAFGLSAPQNSAGEVSIGSPGQERQITNLAAGSSATDAVNVAQLEGVVANATGDAVQYDDATKASITLGGPVSTDGGVTGGTKITNLQQGALSATSTDAVNGAQLFATNNNVSTINNTVGNIYNTTSKYFQANSVGAASLAVGTDSLAAGPASVATGNASIAFGSGAVTGVGADNAIAIGTGANASFANSIALGNGSVTTVGALTGYTAFGLAAPQTSSGEVNIGNRQITGVAAASVATDAVNLEQLQGVVANATGDSVQYDDANKTSISLAGPVSTDGGVTGGTKITNLQQGTLNATSTDAVNGAQLFATNNSIENINNTTGKYYQANSIGIGSSAIGTDSLAAGPAAIATGNTSIAFGSGAATLGDSSVALGTGASATFANSVALGAGSATLIGAQSGYTAFGLAAPQTSSGEVNVGNRQITGVAAANAADDAVNLAQLQGVVSSGTANSVQYDDPSKTSITLAGPVSTDGGVTGGTKITNLQQGVLGATSTDAVNGTQLFATNNTVSNIYNTTSKYFQANSTGTGSSAVGTDSLAVGPASVASGNASIAFGSGAVTGAGDDNAIAIGTGANASFANSIALGNGSVTTVGAQMGYIAYGLAAPQTSSGEVNVGNRQITGVAAGSGANDAVNVEQLEGVVAAGAANSVQYDNAGRTSITLTGPVSTDGGVTGGTTITNLHQGSLSATSTDAVNGSQLWHATMDTTNQYSNYSLYDDINNAPGSKYYAVNSTLGGSQATGANAAALGPNALATGMDTFAIGNGATAQGDYSLAVGANAQTSGVDSIAVGNGANASMLDSIALGAGSTANFANSIALGAGSVTMVGALTNYTAYGLAAPQTSTGEIAVGNRQITGVAAGSAPTDAVNLAQLEAVTSQGGTGGNGALAVLYDADSSGNPTNEITLTGNGTGAPVGITNVAAGAETATSTDAVNGSQLYHWTQDTSNIYSNYSLYNDISSLTSMGGGGANSKYVQVNSSLGGAIAGGTNSVAIGPVANASGANSVAVGNGASAAADNSVALGAGSVANRNNTVSVGSVGSERQITNVAAGTSDTDAANVGQLNTGVQQAENWANSYTDQRVGALSSEIQQVGNRANAGVAAAMAMAGLPQAYEPGKSMVAAAAGTFRSESSLAVGVSTISEGGRWVYKMTGSVDTRGDGGLSIGAGMQW